MTGKKERNVQLDSIKFCLIVLVIAGHVFSKIETSWPSGCCRVTWQWIYMFHMPLFVALSGYFSHKKSIKTFFKFFKIVRTTSLVPSNLYYT